MENIRQTTERIERETLSQYAVLSENTKGRAVFEEPCDMRTSFQRDRDRIIHCKAFRRLKHKTQVFLSPESDHYRTRLTHTLEVAQIARTISRSLRLNEDLTEAIALGHDLGHTPFGHAGERALDKCVPFDFTHYEQSVRVCRLLEREGRGLNLTEEVLDGIKNHTKGELPKTLEGRVVRISDRIAYINHDIDDAVRGGIISADDIPSDIVSALGTTKSQRINTLVTSVVRNSAEDILMDEKTAKYFDDLHEFLFSNVYRNPKAKNEETKVDGIITGIFDYMLKNPEKLTGEYAKVRDSEGTVRAAADYVSGMTDHYAVTVYSDIFIPKFWEV
ncbi:MAG: deoxyguanosinetriphosphate triphosphohydrolase [Clostridia bacterium]|nr:deoxyguanosinetriphosphate triphosphohydrolase [Clostridia bacterium]